MGEGVLEGVCEIREEAGFVEEFGGLQVAEPAARSSSDNSPMACRRAKGTSVPMTAAVWRRRFSSGGRRSMRAARTACTVAGACRLSRDFARREAPRSPTSTPVSTRARTLSSRKRGCPQCARLRAA